MMALTSDKSCNNNHYLSTAPLNGMPAEVGDGVQTGATGLSSEEKRQENTNHNVLDIQEKIPTNNKMYMFLEIMNQWRIHPASFSGQYIQLKQLNCQKLGFHYYNYSTFPLSSRHITMKFDL